MLGVKPYGEGGVMVPATSASGAGGGAGVNISLAVHNEPTIEVHIDGNNADADYIMQTIRDSFGDLTNEMCDKIGLELQKVFANMSREAEGAY